MRGRRALTRIVASLALATAVTNGARADNDRPDLPRITGVIVGPNLREAMFAPVGDAAVMVVNEGETIGPFRVRSIQPGQVELVGPGGSYDLTVERDDNLRARLITLPPNVPLIDPSRREVETENDQ